MAHARALGERRGGRNGGQLIIILPALDMVIGITGGNYGEGRKFFKWETELVPRRGAAG
ncbi:MAG TPA: hypothetical protein VEO54_05605 [Thermoanaerobaculia bacterium]|nr:hypothetical protein [Thermoanaerobaculia bacterium]